MDMYTLLYVKWITSKDLRYSTGNSAPMLRGSLDGKAAWGSMHILTCMAESLCCSPKTLTTLLTGYTPIQNKNLKRNK